LIKRTNKNDLKMGNICDCCRKGQRRPPQSPSISSSLRLDFSTSRERSNSVTLLHCVPIPLDDDWADEIWYDAVEMDGGSASRDEGDDGDGHGAHHEKVFEVTPQELSILKEQLAKEFPQDATYMSDAYLSSVASKPYSKDMSIRRPLDYTMEKLMHVMEWRKEQSASEMPKWIDVCNTKAAATSFSFSSNDANEDGEEEGKLSPKLLKRAQNMVTSLNNGSMYWHGFTKDGRPILWLRTNRKFWYPDVQAEGKNESHTNDLFVNAVNSQSCFSHLIFIIFIQWMH